MVGIKRDLTGNNDFTDAHNLSIPYYDLKTEIMPVNVLNGPKNPVLTSVKVRGTMKYYNVDNSSPVTGSDNNFDFTPPTHKKWLLLGVSVEGVSLVGTFSAQRDKILVGSNYFLFYYLGTGVTQYLLNNTQIVIDNNGGFRSSVRLSAYTSGTIRVQILVMEFDEEQL